MLVPSLATPECPQMPPPMAAVAQAMTLEGLLILIPITHPWYVPQSPASPENGTYRTPFTIASPPLSFCTFEVKVVPVMPSGLMLPHGSPDVTAGPRLRCQMMLPLLASSA